MSLKCNYSCGTTPRAFPVAQVMLGWKTHKEHSLWPQSTGECACSFLEQCFQGTSTHSTHSCLSGSVLAGIVFGTGRKTAVCLPSLPDSISPAATCQPRGRKPSPFLSGNHISPCYNEILSVIQFQSEQADFLICRDFISLWECLLPLL